MADECPRSPNVLQNPKKPPRALFYLGRERPTKVWQRFGLRTGNPIILGREVTTQRSGRAMGRTRGSRLDRRGFVSETSPLLEVPRPS